MASALLLIATFHAVLWVSLAVLTVLEPPHPERRPELLATSRAVMPDEPAAEHDSEHDGESLRPGRLRARIRRRWARAPPLSTGVNGRFSVGACSTRHEALGRIPRIRRRPPRRILGGGRLLMSVMSPAPAASAVADANQDAQLRDQRPLQALAQVNQAPRRHGTFAASSEGHGPWAWVAS